MGPSNLILRQETQNDERCRRFVIDDVYLSWLCAQDFLQEVIHRVKKYIRDLSINLSVREQTYPTIKLCHFEERQRREILREIIDFSRSFEMTDKQKCHAGLRSGIHSHGVTSWQWIPAFAGMTNLE